MENHLAHPLAAQAVALFQIYDQAGIGQISRHALLRFFYSINPPMQPSTNRSLSSG